MSRAFVPAHARAPTLAMSIVPRAMTHDFPRIVTDGGVAGAPERRAREARSRAPREHLARASTATTTRATRDGEGETSASARGAMVASCLALAMTLAGVDGEAASAATAREGRSWAQSRGRFERISRARGAHGRGRGHSR